MLTKNNEQKCHLKKKLNYIFRKDASEIGFMQIIVTFYQNKNNGQRIAFLLK